MPPQHTSVTTSTTSRVGAKFSSILETPIDTAYIDLKRAQIWLASYGKKECPLHETLITSIVISHLEAHRMPDPKVLRNSISYLALPSDQVQRLMRKLWTKLLEEQTHSMKKKMARSKTSPPKESGGEARPHESSHAPGRTSASSSSPPLKRISPPTGWDYEPPPRALCHSTRTGGEYSRHSSVHPSRSSIIDYDQYYAQAAPEYPSAVHYRPRKQHSGTPPTYSRSHFV